MLLSRLKMPNILLLKENDSVDFAAFYLIHEIYLEDVISLCISRTMTRPRLESDLFNGAQRGQYLCGFNGIGFTFGNGLYRAI